MQCVVGGVMSEYQYYEFQSVDKRLTEEEKSEIRKISSRVNPTANTAIFTYSYSDLRAEPMDLMKKYFDAMLYIANWGTKRLMFRFPKQLIDTDLIQEYCVRYVIEAKVTSKYVIVDITTNNEEGFGWIEPEDELSPLIQLRQDLLHGDYRFLYLAWLKAIEEENEKLINKLEPPVPPNLKSLSPALKSFVDFFEINQDLIKVAAEESVDQDTANRLDIASLVVRLSEEERNSFLVRVANGEPNIDMELIKRLEQFVSVDNPLAGKRRKVADLLKKAEDAAIERRAEEKRRAEEQRIKELKALAKREPEVWADVMSLINQKTPNAYDVAIEHLKRLNELSKYLNKKEEFDLRTAKLAEEFRKRPSLIGKMKKGGLI
jgi:hypothetical protein